MNQREKRKEKNTHTICPFAYPVFFWGTDTQDVWMTFWSKPLDKYLSSQTNVESRDAMV